MSHQNITQAARAAVADRMAADERVLVIGEDVASGGPFGVTKQLAEKHGTDRVRNTPISEGAIMGVAVGLALAGQRPLVDLMFNDFVTAASDQLFNHAAKIRFMSGGQYSVGLTIWTTGGAGTRWAAQHSQRLDGWFAQIPGLKLLAPSTPAMTYAALTQALDDPDPCVVLADRSMLLSRKGLAGDDDASPWHARMVREGDALTVVTTGRLSHLAVEIAEREQLPVEVIDAQRLAPLDVDPILASLEKTSRLLICHDEASPGGWSSLLAAEVAQHGFWLLDAPVARLTSPGTPVPAAAPLEDAYQIGDAELLRAMTDALS